MNTKLGIALTLATLLASCADQGTTPSGAAASAAPRTIAQPGGAPAVPPVGIPPGGGPH